MGMGWISRSRKAKGSDPYRVELIKVGVICSGEEASLIPEWKRVGGRVARLLVRNQWSMVYCGMATGLSGHIAKTMLSAGGEVEAIVVRGYQPPEMPPGVEIVRVNDFHARKRKLFESADAFAVLPGGLGTLSEVAEMLAFRDAGLMHKPIVVMNLSNWFGPINGFIHAGMKDNLISKSANITYSMVTNIPALKQQLLLTQPVSFSPRRPATGKKRAKLKKPKTRA